MDFSNVRLKAQAALNKKVVFIQVFADIHLLVGSIISVILPFFGFISCCMLVRYKNDYSKCVVENYGIKASDMRS